MIENKKSNGRKKHVLEIIVYDIKGYCPVYKEGDKIMMEDPKIILNRTDALCTHALSTILHYTTILAHDWCPVKLGLTTEKDKEDAYMQCVDPGKPYTIGGTVIFNCKKIDLMNYNKQKENNIR